MRIQVAHSSVPKLGEIANGDRAFLREDSARRMLFGVIDGLGHGPEAEKASLAALAYLDQIVLTSSLKEVMFGLHAALRGTRGAAGMVCIAIGRHLYACSVGNVEMRPVRTEFPMILSAGILGVRVSTFRICQAELKTPCRLAVYSDGITNPTSLSEYHEAAPKVACDGILRRHRRDYDDATVLIADVE